MMRLPIAMMLLLTLYPTAAAALDSQETAALRNAFTALRELRVEDAAEVLETLVAANPSDASVLDAMARLRLHQGRYADGVAAMQASLEARPATRADDSRQGLLELLISTRDTTADYERAQSDDGRFIVSYAPGRDITLVPYALEALRRIDAAMTIELGVRLPGPIRLELYPNAETLAAVSALTVENITTSGTIALCKWDRLMVTSPRALVRGYPWMDTIAHEFVHLALTRASQDHAPVWFQEGVAKFFERRWRESEPRHVLSPSVQGLLDNAVREDRLLPFERLHPSIALLPSQSDAALAFAQVASFIARFHAAYGGQKLRDAVEAMARGADARDALAAVTSSDWTTLESNWRGSLTPTTRDTPGFRALRFREGSESSSNEVDASEREEVTETARRSLRLGDMLWARQRYGAAAVQYGRALEAAPGDPIVSSRLARAALAAGDGQRAVDALTPIAQSYPEHEPTRALLGAALKAIGDSEGARREAEAAIALNPFDPRPHCVIAALSSEAQEQRRESRACAALGGEAP